LIHFYKEKYFLASVMRAISNEPAVSTPCQSKKFSVKMKAKSQRKSCSSQKKGAMPSKVCDKVAVTTVVASSKRVKSNDNLNKAFPPLKKGCSSGAGFSFAKERFNSNSVNSQPRHSTPSTNGGLSRVKALPLKEKVGNCRLKLSSTSPRRIRTNGSSKSNSPSTTGAVKPKLLTNSVGHLTQQLKRKDNEIRKLKQKLWSNDPSVVGGNFSGLNLDKVNEKDYDLVKAKLERLSDEIALKEKKIALKETEVLQLTEANSKLKEELERISNVLIEEEERRISTNLEMESLVNEKDEEIITLRKDKDILEYEYAQLRADNSNMRDQVDYYANSSKYRQSSNQGRTSSTSLQQETNEFLERIGSLCLSENDNLRVTARYNGNNVKLHLKVKVFKAIADSHDSHYLSFSDTIFEDSRVDNSFMDSTRNTCNDTRFVSFSDTFKDS